jgi:hypothetical protein
VEVAAAEPRRDPRATNGAARNRERRGVVDISSRQMLPEVDESAQPAAPLEAASAAALTTEESPSARMPRGRGTVAKPLRIYPFGVSRNRLEQSIEGLGLPATVVRDQRDADIVMTLKNHYRRKPQPLREAEIHGTPVYVLRANTGVQIEHVLRGLFPALVPALDDDRPMADYHPAEARSDESPRVPVTRGEPRTSGENPLTRAMVEAEDAITRVIDGAPPVELAPQGSHVRRLQHELAERYNVASRSRGREPNRRVEIYRAGMR